MAIVCGLILLLFFLNNLNEIILQVVVLTLGLIIYPNLISMKSKLSFKKDILIISIYSILMGEIIWLLHPKSEIQTVLQYLRFHIKHDFLLFLFGLIISILKNGVGKNKIVT